MFGIGGGEAIVIVVLALLIVGPEKLPTMIRDASRWIRDLRRMVDSTRRDLTDTLGPELRDLGIEDLRDLDPRQYVRRHVLDGLDEDLSVDEPRHPNGSTAADRDGASRQRSRRQAPADGAPTFDPDAT